MAEPKTAAPKPGPHKVEWIDPPKGGDQQERKAKLIETILRAIRHEREERKKSDAA